MVRIERMGAEDYSRCESIIVDELARSLVAIGSSPILEARNAAAKEKEEILAEREQTQGQYLLNILDDNGSKNGFLWLGVKQGERVAFLFEIHVFEGCRRHGFGREALFATEKLIRGLGLERIQTFIVNRNETARAFYRSCGYWQVWANDAGEVLEKDLVKSSIHVPEPIAVD